MIRIALCTCVAALFTCGALAKSPAKDIDLVCKDGEKITVQTTRGACNGHGGIDKKASAKLETKHEAKRETRHDEVSTRASGAAGTSRAGSDKVWVNEASGVYHCRGDRWYGKTQRGEYMTEAQAKDKGFRPDHDKACA